MKGTLVPFQDLDTRDHGREGARVLGITIDLVGLGFGTDLAGFSEAAGVASFIVDELTLAMASILLRALLACHR